MPGWTGDGPAKDTKPKAGGKDTVKVERGPVTVAVKLKAGVQSDDNAEIAVKLKTWSNPLLVRKAVPHGEAVKAGDIVVEFETDKIDQAIRDARQERAAAEVAIKQLELDIPTLEKQNALELAAATRGNRNAADDLDRYLSTDQPMAKVSAEYQMKVANFMVEYAREELKQLQKMYKDKDLTEETEKLILRRYQFMLEMDEFQLKQAKQQNERLLQVDLPRRETATRDSAERAELALVKARDLQPLLLKQKQLALAKLVFDEEKARERLAELDKDRAAMTLRAPRDGVAYHGRLFRGQWLVPNGPQENSLLPGTPAGANAVLLTIVPPGKRFLRATVEEKDIPGLTTNLDGTFAPTATPDKKSPVKLASLATTPLDGKFEVRINVDPKSVESLVPGTTGMARFVTYRKADALTIPASAAFEDDDEGHYVYRPGATPRKQAVRVGHRSGDRIEILSGLSENDEILASKP